MEERDHDNWPGKIQDYSQPKSTGGSVRGARPHIVKRTGLDAFAPPRAISKWLSLRVEGDVTPEEKRWQAGV